MSRKITDESVYALMNGYRFKKANMEVETHFEYIGGVGVQTTKMYLHGNCIAKKIVKSKDSGDTIISSRIYISDAGWRTTTTKERLNGIPWVSIVQKKGVWYLNGKEWDGSWIAIY